MRLSFGPFILDSVRGTLTRDGRLVPTNHKGIALLTALLRTPGEVVGKTTLMDAAWPGTSVEESNLSRFRSQRCASCSAAWAMTGSGS
jgi:DNA-binding winged helix-turn-helix (wHTH) protein